MMSVVENSRIILLFFFLNMMFMPHKHKQNIATANTEGMGIIIIITTNAHKNTSTLYYF